jgi:hypothetical protein
MKLKLDENLSRHLKPVLTDLGHDVLTAAYPIRSRRR